MVGLNIKTVIILVGIVCAVVGILMNNWKVATVGNSISLAGMLFA